MKDWGWDEIADRFCAARNWWVGTTTATGAPHVVPVWGVVVDGVLVFYGDATTKRSRNLARDPRVVIHLGDGDDPLILHGTAHATAIARDRPDLAVAYAAKYRREHDAGYLLDTAYAQDAVIFEVEPRWAMAWTVTAVEDWRIRRWPAGDDPSPTAT